MNCCYHPDRPGLGICKHCGRALCSECIALVDDTVACKNRHEEHVRGRNIASQRSILQGTRLRSGYVRNAVFYGLVGLLFAGFGLSQLRFLGLQAVFFALIGAFLLYAATANYLEGRKYR
jgi:sulfite exporter TauE/SafE